jgi:hypothetical protein
MSIFKNISLFRGESHIFLFYLDISGIFKGIFVEVFWGAWHRLYF